MSNDSNEPTTAADYAALAADAADELALVQGATEQVRRPTGTVRVGPAGMSFSDLVKQEPLRTISLDGFPFERVDLQPWQLAAVAGLARGGRAAVARDEQRAAEDVIEGRVLPDGPWKLPQYREERRPHPGGIFGVLIDEMAGFWDGLTDGLIKFGKAAAEAGLVPEEEPPTDPRARALWMKQHRGHGPETPKSWRQR